MPDTLIALDGKRIVPAAPGFTARFQSDAAEFEWIVVGWYPGPVTPTDDAIPRAGGPIVWDGKAQCVALAADVAGDFEGVYIDGMRV